MEVVGFTAAAISIAKTTKTVIRLVRLLYRAAKNSSSVGNHMQHFAIMFRNFAYVVKHAMEKLDTLHQKNQGSPVLRHMLKMTPLDSVAEEACFLEAQVNDLKDEIPKIKSRFDFVMSFRWTRMKPDMEALFAPMTNLKTTISLMIDVIMLEGMLAQLRESRTAQLETEM